MNVQEKFRTPDPRTGGYAPPRKKGLLARLTSGRALLLALVIAAGAGGAYYYYGRGTDAAKPVVVTATRGDVEDVVTAVGTLQPFNSVDVGAQVSGQLKKLYVQIGNDVTKDQQLAEIDSAVFSAKVDADEAQLQNLQAQLLEKQSSLVLAKQQADRQVRLMDDNATSQDAYDTAQSAAKVADAQVKALEAQIRQSQSTLKADQATLGYSKIYAPVAGTVSAIPAKEGQTLNANQQTPTILTISDLTTMTVQTQVSEADVPKLTVGMPAYFTTLGDQGRRYTGTLRQVLPTPTVTNNVVLYTALFDVANTDKKLMTQMTAQVFFVRASAHNVVTVPVAALHFTDQGPGRGARNGGQRNGQGNNAGSGGQAAAPAPAAAQVAQTGAGDAAAPRRGGQGAGQGGGRFGQGRRQQADVPGAHRPATVTVMKDDGTTEMRNVVAGVTDRVNAEIVSGLSEGEKVVAGSEAADTAARPRGQQQGQQAVRIGGPGGIGGFR